ISIGGNNLLGVSTDRLILLAVQGADGRVANEILSKLDTDINRILARLRELNGSCKIWLQTVYDPFSGADSPLLSAVSGVTSSLAARARELYQKAAQKREAVRIVDVYDVFSKHAAKSHSRDYYSTDGAHPSAMGNEAIADAYVSRMSGAGVICAEPSKTGDNLAAGEDALKKLQPIGEGAAVFADEGGVRLESAGAGGLAVIGQIPRDAIGIEFVAVANRELKAAAAGFADEGKIAVFNTSYIFRIGSGGPTRHRIIFADHADAADTVPAIDRICITAEEKATIQIQELRFVRAAGRG
ncbi:MAG: SGNH/GDSL hydrolase family protein, partial [Acutalibacteraceae bacterium]